MAPIINSESEESLNYKSIADSVPVLIMKIDPSGIINYMNYVYPGYKMEEVIGSSAFEYVDPSYHEIYRNTIQSVLDTKIPERIEIKVNLLNSAAWFELHLAPVMKNEKVDGFVVVSLDVTEKKEALFKLENALKEKQILLKEVHHRSKNNLQILSSILNLHKGRTDDSNVIDVIEECKNSIQSLALAHECLYKSDDFSKIDFAEYLKQFCAYFKNYVSSNEKITIELDLKSTYISMDKAITSGLILSEILVNSFKYAFKGIEKGVVKVKLVANQDLLTLSVSDNGIGFSNQVDFQNTDSLGLELIRILVEQLEGKINFKSDKEKGTHYIIQFKK